MSWRDQVLARFAAGEISREVALAQLLLSGHAPEPDSLPAPLAELARTHAARLGKLSALAREGFDVSDTAGAAALFDRLADGAPEAGVAFYALGDPDLLAAATRELAGVVRSWAPLAGRRALDFGCGIGRLSAALAPDAASLIGVDVSGGMVAQARARVTGGDVRFEQMDGRSLSLLADGSVDVLIAADSLPFVIQAGALNAVFAEWARVLGPDGDILVFNWSYRGDDALDRVEAGALARRHGLDLLRAGERPFAIWDGTGYHLRRRDA